MRLHSFLLAIAGALLAGACSSPAGSPQAAVADRLYVIDCGHGRAGDVSRWTPGVHVGEPRDFVDTCYLVRHGQDWLLWDTGIPDAVASMPQGLAPPDPRATHWFRHTTLAASLKQIGVDPAQIRYVAISHSHPDHIGNLALFPRAQLLVQRAEYDWPAPEGKPRFPPLPAAVKLDGDRDVFGDGSVRLIATPGHTPGHESLLVRLRRTGSVLLSGDAVHFRENWDAHRAPAINVDKAATLASMDKLAGIMAAEHAQLWINHDAEQRARMKLSPDSYD